jgi:hypothetical protein
LQSETGVRRNADALLTKYRNAEKEEGFWRIPGGEIVVDNYESLDYWCEFNSESFRLAFVLFY